jgi:putative MATE family efflux protein
MAKSIGMNMTKGNLFLKMIKFSVPLIFTYWLQLAFNFTDVMVLGLLVGDAAVGAVGSTASLISLITGLFMGVSVGATILISRYLGEGKEEKVRKVVGLSMIVSVAFGLIILVIGFTFSRRFLLWMDNPPELIGMATLYLKIYSLGMPIRLLYNFCTSILRASGETVKPMIFLAIGGVLNIGLNVFFILVLNMTVEGVAIATVVSELVSAILCIIVLVKNDGSVKLCKQYIRFYKNEFISLLKEGLPSGIQSCLFAISNVIVQASVNSFGDIVVSGNSYAGQIENFIYHAMYAFSVGTMTFVSQNYGAGNLKNIKKSTLFGLILGMGTGFILSTVCWIFSYDLVSLLSDNPDVILAATTRMDWICRFYYGCAFMEAFSYSLKGLGKSTLAMYIALLGTCVFRIVWIKTLLPIFYNISVVYSVYLVSWLLVGVACFIALMFSYKKIKKKFAVKEDDADKQLNQVVA